ncbi:GGDEF domain-containing protein [Granulosicoccus antarcticus]|uniref:diguanylate cyclase n=1 Tax=Granulosicoccus antarcticus IMCC3135 TaxID=1192854 RepID=A0A2Z2NN39_9GAMM|nr:GGDEF domain-containing protein [Granulosicoccus antarcticus]ASJ72643.1 putative diguanylate cyclase YdaM [Granulosicoccus antarcticus IMCC3135]
MPRIFSHDTEETGSDFRSKATLGVAITAVLLLLPAVLLDLLKGELAIGIGAFCVVFILSANAWIVLQGRCHQRLTQYGLIPAGMVFMTSIFQMDGLIASLWCYPIVLAAYCMLSERRAWFANAVILLLALPMVWLTLDPTYAFRVTTTLVATSIFAAILVWVIDDQRRMLEMQLTLDPLTGLLNRLTYTKRMEQAVHEHEQHGKRISLLAIDVDNFKKLNDHHGHAVGDYVLSQIGLLLKNALREEDNVFRMGGEEFTVILINANERAAIETAERIRRQIGEHDYGINSAVTISTGVAEHLQDESWAAWAKRGDDRLYEAKHKGRNRVVAAQPKEVVKLGIVSLP